jgi:hypothetical protein
MGWRCARNIDIICNQETSRLSNRMQSKRATLNAGTGDETPYYLPFAAAKWQQGVAQKKLASCSLSGRCKNVVCASASSIAKRGVDELAAVRGGDNMMGR